ncbi:MAG: phosphoribosylformylglycinamidine synthase, purS protein [Candidatus Riflebacteria bacterium RBG_13_59_9]|nr:MAG: phosphoribosylformylglycinamidine synthase, purS protein [Candidatus Riflebacteria bacterium RBG_13_59_9]
MKFAGIVSIRLREDLLDPQGKAVMSGLRQLGFETVEDVRVGKQVKVVFEAEDGDAAMARLEEMCTKLLVNPVTEDYDTIILAEE